MKNGDHHTHIISELIAAVQHNNYENDAYEHAEKTVVDDASHVYEDIHFIESLLDG